MFTFRDFIHLPELDNLVRQMANSEPGLILVAGWDTGSNLPGARGSGVKGANPQGPLPSGKSAIFNILVQDILATSKSLKAVAVGQNRSTVKPVRRFKHQVELSIVEQRTHYIDHIDKAFGLKPDLLIVDHLNSENLQAVFKAAARGMKVIAQMDAIVWGAGVPPQLHEMGLLPEQMGPLQWIISVFRVPRLCVHCRQPSQVSPETWQRLRGRYPHLSDWIERLSAEQSEAQFFTAGHCERCQESGRSNEISVFDIYEAPTGESRLSLEEYLLRLAGLGYLPLEDLLSFETGLLRRLHNQLLASEYHLDEAQASLKGKYAELEAANRVLVQRTEELVSFQELGQALIATNNLAELAQKVVRQACEMCGADRAILYVRRPLETEAGSTAPRSAEILAVSGWSPVWVHQQVPPLAVFANLTSARPTGYAGLPPGIDRQGEENLPTFQASLRVPLVALSRPVGAMFVHSAKKNSFKPGEIATLQAFANQAALAIQRAGLIDELRAKIEQLESAQAELVKKERLERELELAREVQQRVLPTTFPEVSGFRFSARYEAARRVGGDFYDIIALAEGRFAAVVGDVSDKGMPAALYMALTRSLILAEARRETSPAQVLQNVNRMLLELGEPGGFVTVFLAMVDPRTRRMKFCRAGHDRPYLLRQGELVPLPGEGSFLGVLEPGELELGEEELELYSSDRLILFTDGLSDVFNPAGEIFGQERLAEALLQQAHRPLGEYCGSIFSILAEFQGEAEQFDDMTMLVIEAV